MPINHRKVSSGIINSDVEVDLSDWNDDHEISDLVINQTGPATPATAPFFYNNIQINNSTPVTGTGLYGLRPLNDTNGILVQLNVSGPASGTLHSQNAARYFYNQLSGSTVTGDAIGLIADAFSAGATVSILHGLQASTVLQSGGTAGSIEGSEHIAAIYTGGSTPYRFGIAVGNAGQLQGTTLDAAIAVNNYSAGATGAFKKLIALTSTSPGLPPTSLPLTTDADFFYADTAYTVANIFHLPNVTVTGKILDFPNVSLSGAGVLKLGAGTADNNPGVMVQATVVSGGSAILVSQADGVAAFDGFKASTSTGGTVLFSVAVEPSSVVTIFGQANGNWSEIVSLGPNNNGILLGTLVNKPIVFGTNNTEHMRLLAGLAVGLTTDPGAGVVSALTGFRVNNAATSGHVLRGDGTNFVDAALALGDLPVLTGYTSGAGTVSTADSILSAIQKLNGNDGLKANLSGGNTLSGTQVFSNLISASGGQVAFPATQNPSADPNTLDDYEEGTWTPVLTFATPGDLARTYTLQGAYYTKIGRVVTANFVIQTASFSFTTASGALQITGLPFATINDANYRNYATAVYSGVTKAGYTSAALLTLGNSSTILLVMSGSGVAAATVQAPDTPTGGTVIVAGSITYNV